MPITTLELVEISIEIKQWKGVKIRTFLDKMKSRKSGIFRTF